MDDDTSRGHGAIKGILVVLALYATAVALWALLA